MAQNQIRQNFSHGCEAGLNRQINLQLYASFAYESMAFYFDQDDVALPGFRRFFKHKSDKMRELAEKLMEYQNKRGGRVVLQDIKKPESFETTTGQEAMKAALKLERDVNSAFIDLRQVAETNGDDQMGDFVEGFLEAQVESIKKTADLVTSLSHVGPGLGEFVFDKNTLQKLHL